MAAASHPSYPSQQKRPPKPPAPPEFLETCRAVALSGTDGERIVLDCFVKVWDEQSVGASNKPKRDIACRFKDKQGEFQEFKLTLWEELALDTGPVLKEQVHWKWSQVEVDLKSASLNAWTGRDGTEHKDVQIGKAWILLPAPDGRWAPVHEPLPEPVEEEYPADDIDDGVDPFLPEFDDDEDGDLTVEGGEEEEVDPNDL